MISLILPPKTQIAQTQAMLQTEYGTASNIKQRVNRQSVLAAITSAQSRLKLYSKVPDNGLILYTGTVLTDDGKEKKVNVDFEPFKPINTSLYLCDNKFHTEALSELMISENRYGFIVIDGNGTLFGALSGSAREVLHRFKVDLPSKHGRGGQSALRFARQRIEKRHNYIRKVTELAAQNFISNDRPNISGLVLAGSADFKTELSQSDIFDQRLRSIVVAIVDVSYGGDNGFNQAIEISSESLSNVRFVQEQKLICRFFDEIAKDTKRHVYGLLDTINALHLGAIETLILWENFELTLNASLFTTDPYPDKSSGKPEIKHLIETLLGQDFATEANTSLVDWLSNNYKKFGCILEFVSNKSQEGSQFVKGFGGIGGILRYQIEPLDSHCEPNEMNEIKQEKEFAWDTEFDFI
jgi:peptide chain release factor subunit 1